MSYNELNSPPGTATADEKDQLLPSSGEGKPPVEADQKSEHTTGSQFLANKVSNPELRSLHSTTTSQNQVSPSEGLQ
jgi:hypothetical protein